jgi:hypothetical protein
VRTYWLGGGTGAGKTTVARALAARFGLRRFSIDAFSYAYEDDGPRKSADERWLATPPAEHAREFEETARHMHRRALEELATLPPMPTVVEGPQVLPELVPPGDGAVFLIPTPEFQRAVLEPRPMPSSDPAQALANRLIRDRLYADRIAARASVVLEVDGTHDVVDEVAQLLEVESEPIDLAAARRWENEAVAANRRAWIASGDHRVSSDVVFTWVCECGARGCDAVVRLTLAAFEASSVRSAH